jgi:hypothetical protein
MLISQLSRGASTVFRRVPSVFPALAQSILTTASFSIPAASLTFGSSHSPFLQIDRLSFLQKSTDHRSFNAALLNRLGQRELVSSPAHFSDAPNFLC